MKKQLTIISASLIMLFGGLFAAAQSVPAVTLTVTKIADTNDNVCDADCSLREAIAATSPAGGDVIVFASPLFDTAQTITLTHGELFNDGKSLIIDGPGANKLTVSANQASRVFRFLINSGTVELKGITIADGVWYGDGSENGGAGIFKHGSGGTLKIEFCAVSRNHAGGAVGYGGGLSSFSPGEIKIRNSTFDNNSATFGGGIFINNGHWEILNSTISGNTASDNGGGISFGDGDYPGNNDGGIRIIYNSTIAFNNTNVSGFGGISGYSGNNILRNSIVAANTGGLDAFETGFERYLSLGNVVQSGFYPETNEATLQIPNIYNQNAKLAPLDYYGGTTRTHALLQDSPAHEAADECIVRASWRRCVDLDERLFGSSITSQIDQRGQPRLIINPDSGAFEENFKFERSHLPYGIGGAAYSQAITVKRMINAIGDEAAVPNAVFSVLPLAGEQLPPGLSLSPAGVLSGTPTTLGSFTFTLKMLDPDTDTGAAARYTVVIRSESPPAMIVTKTADTNDGVCDADCSLREAVNNVFLGEAIGFSSLFDTAQTITLTAGELVVSKPLTINGKGVSLTTVSGNNQNRVFRLTITADLTINDLTITGGRGDGVPERYVGEIGRGGGGIHNVSGRLTVNRSRVVNNVVVGPQYFKIHGGGIFNYRGARLLLSDSVVSGNTSGSLNVIRGIGIYNERAKATITNSIISDNTPSPPNFINNDGGGIYSISGALDMTGTTITGNNLRHESNDGNGFGAGAYISHGTAAIKNSTISHNNWLSTNGFGGGIALIASNTIITGSTITDNIAVNGGGIYMSPSDSVPNRVYPLLSVRNSIISGNKLRLGYTIGADIGVGAHSISFTVDDHNYIGGDARLAPLGNYGGATPTHALLADSPALNAGNNCVLNSSCLDANPFPALTADQRGSGRRIGAAVDIGAYERNITFDQSTLPNGNRNQPYNQTLTATRQTSFAEIFLTTRESDLLSENASFAPFTFSVIAIAGQQLPPGLTLSSDGSLSGTPTQSGIFTFTVKVTDADGIAGAARLSILITGNSPPAISGATISRISGSVSNSRIATVSVPDGTAGSFSVTVTSANPSNGVTVSNIINTNGAITADVAAACDATAAAFTLTATGGDGATTSATLTVNVTANTPPTLAYQSQTAAAPGASFSVAPTAASDNGTVAYLIQSVSPVLTNPPTVDANGVVSFAGTTPIGSYTIIVRAADNCGATTDASFNLVVRSTLVTKIEDTDDNVCDADCSLREAIGVAISGETIRFASPLFDTERAVTLTLGQLVINKPLVIHGRNAGLTTISGNSQSRVFNVAGTGNLTLENLTVSGGRTLIGDVCGGGILNSGGVLTVNLSNIKNNTVTGATGSDINRGGGICNTNSGNLTVRNSSISDNSSTGSNNFGVGIYNDATLTIENSVVSGNRGDGASGNNSGSGVFHGSGTMTVANSTVSGNSGNGSLTSGSGVYAQSGTATITNSTITRNGCLNNCSSSNNFGGGLSIDSATVRVRNTIVSGNIAGSSNPNILGTLALNQNNLIGGDARLAPLGNYGGATPTHALLSDSPALNAGNNCVLDLSCPNFNLNFSLTTDQRGADAPRKIGASVDIGAFERNITFDQSMLPEGSLFLLYNEQLTATRQIIFTAKELLNESSVLAPTTFQIIPVAGQQLPPGINLSSGGLLSGEPTMTGNYTFTVKATDTDGMAGVQEFVLTIFRPLSASVTISGRVLTPDGRGLVNAFVTITDMSGTAKTARTSAFGYYKFEDIAAGQTYFFTIRSKSYEFTPQALNVMEDVAELNFTANP